MSSPILPPPDITGYVDLRIFDVSDQVIIDTAIANTRLNLPGWVPNEGNTEVILIESTALLIAEAIVAVNRLPGAVAAAMLMLAGVSRDLGAPPSATATVTFADTLGHTVPGGTRIFLTLGDGSSIVFLVEPPGLTVPGGSTFGDVSLIGDTFTAAANGTTAGGALTMADQLTSVQSVVLSSDVAGGRDPESDNAWRDRGVERLSRLSDALVVPSHFTAAALENPAVAAALTLDLWDGSGGAPGDDPGHITVAVLGPNGATLSAGDKADLEASMETRAVAVLDVHVINATVVTVPVATKVVPAAGFVFATVQASVTAAITAYLDPLAWTFGSTIYLNEMISLIDQVPGVDRVVTITLNAVAADYVLSGVASLPKAGTITVTQGP